jgi:hypothetical protein
VSWLRWLVPSLLPSRAKSETMSIHVRFLVDKVALEQVVSKFLGFPPSISFHCGSQYSCIIWDIKIGLLVVTVQRNSLTQSTWRTWTCTHIHNKQLHYSWHLSLMLEADSLWCVRNHSIQTQLFTHEDMIALFYEVWSLFPCKLLFSIMSSLR